MIENETQFVQAVKRAFLASWPTGYWRKLVGGPMQTAGLPDVLAVCPLFSGLFEFKWVKRFGRNTSLWEDALRLVSARQRAEIRATNAAAGAVKAVVVAGARASAPAGSADVVVMVGTPAHGQPWSHAYWSPGTQPAFLEGVNHVTT